MIDCCCALRARPLAASERFTAKQRKCLKEVFDELDTDGSDDLDYTELKQALTGFGIRMSLKELKEMYTKADADASSGISFDEFCDAVEKMPTTVC